MGSILLDQNTLDIVFGSIIGLVGAAYIALEFIPSIEPPQNMRFVLPAHTVPFRIVDNGELTSCS